MQALLAECSSAIQAEPKSDSYLGLRDLDTLTDLPGVVEDLSDTLPLKVTLARPEKDQWVDAICSKLSNIKSEDIYDLVDPNDKNVENLLGNKIVLCHKHGSTGKVEQYKACFTA